MLPDWISAAANTISAISAVVIALGLMLNLREMRDDHDRSRREMAITLIYNWAQSNTRQRQSARKLGDLLTFEDAKDIYGSQEFSLDEKHLDLLNSILEKPATAKDKKIAISPEQSAELRDHIINCLNSLESVLAAWRHNVADRLIIAEQFKNFVSQENRTYILEQFRDVAGGSKAYPSIGQFVRWVRDVEAESDRQGKAPIAVWTERGKPQASHRGWM